MGSPQLLHVTLSLLSIVEGLGGKMEQLACIYFSTVFTCKLCIFTKCTQICMLYVYIAKQQHLSPSTLGIKTLRQKHGLQIHCNPSLLQELIQQMLVCVMIKKQ